MDRTGFEIDGSMCYSGRKARKTDLKKISNSVILALGIAAFAGGVTFGVIHFSTPTGIGGFEGSSEADLDLGDVFLDDTIPPAASEETRLADADGAAPEAGADDSELSYFSYRIKEGDMIGYIADEFGVTQDTIISVNNIRASRLIQIGQYLKIPSLPGIIYTVKKDGETVESIAGKYEVDADKCASVNRIALDQSLSAGQSLFVPYAELDWVTRQEINGDLFKKPIHSWFYYSSWYGWRQSPFNAAKRTFHGGIDMACSLGTSIYAALPGRVTECGWSDVYGNYVIVSHHSGYKTLYGHMSKILAWKGEYVDTTTRIGKVGSTGMSTGPHLHFTVYKNGRSVNPATLLG